MNETDIVELEFKFKIERTDVDELIDAMNSTKMFKQCLNSDCINSISLIKLMQHIPNEFINENTLYTNVRKRGYKFKRKRFMNEIYYLNIYGFIERFKSGNKWFVKNITKDKYILNIEHEIKY